MAESTAIPGEKEASRGDSSSSSSSSGSKVSGKGYDWYNRAVKRLKKVADKATVMPFQPPDPKVWGVLTAVSKKARKRKQGLNMVLNANVHFIGRLVEDYPFRIDDSKAVSKEHCKIYRQTFASGDDALKSQTDVFLKDYSSNGTYVNRTRFTKKDDAVKIHHGDIISFISAPYDDVAIAFVYREVVKPAASSNGAGIKRKAEELDSESKLRFKGIDLGVPEIPISVEYFRSLQNSNTKLQKQLEDQAFTIYKLQNEKRASVEHFQTLESALKSFKLEMKNLKESMTASFFNQIKELQDGKCKELVEACKLTVEQNHAIDDLNGRLQSYTDANETMSSFKEVRGVSSKLRRLTFTNQASQGRVDDESGSKEEM